MTRLLNALDLLPNGFAIGKVASLEGVIEYQHLDADRGARCRGSRAFFALQTRASSAVGVAISVTTIPAAAYLRGRRRRQRRHEGPRRAAGAGGQYRHAADRRLLDAACTTLARRKAVDHPEGVMAVRRTLKASAA